MYAQMNRMRHGSNQIKSEPPKRGKTCLITSQYHSGTLACLCKEVRYGCLALAPQCDAVPAFQGFCKSIPQHNNEVLCGLLSEPDIFELFDGL